MALVAGTIDATGNFVEADSLAKAMDDALANKTEFGQIERRQFLIAIATGVIEYLKRHDADSFQIAVAVDGLTGSGTLTIK